MNKILFEIHLQRIGMLQQLKKLIMMLLSHLRKHNQTTSKSSQT